MTLAYREMQHTKNKEFFRLEFAGQFHKHGALNELVNFVMGKKCQKI